MKITSKGLLSALVLLVAAAAVWGIRRQAEAQTAYTKNIFAMDTLFVLKAYGPEAQEALADAEERVWELQGLFSVTAEDSDIWKINHAENAAGDNIDGRNVNETAVSPDTLSVVETALKLGEETDGALDITVYPVLREWGFTADAFQVPKAERIEQLLEKVDYRRVEIDGSGESAVIRVPEGMELDLGALAKGYAGDCLIGMLREAGVASAILDLGGNVQTLGRKPDGSLWQVAVKDPFDPGAELGVLQVADRAVITSGNYERCFTAEDGRSYGHILDPADGCPVDNGLMSVTVVGESGVLCDGLSTALFVMGKEQALNFWQNRRDFDMILVTDERELYITEGLAECFQGGEGWSVEIITAAE